MQFLTDVHYSACSTKGLHTFSVCNLMTVVHSGACSKRGFSLRLNSMWVLRGHAVHISLHSTIKRCPSEQAAPDDDQICAPRQTAARPQET